MAPEMQASSEVEIPQSTSGINDANTVFDADNHRGTLLKGAKLNADEGFLSVNGQASLLGHDD